MPERSEGERIEEERQREAIGHILPLQIGAAPKAELVLIILGEKPATDIRLAQWNSSPEEFEQTIASAGLAFVKTSKEGDEWSEYSVARSMDTAEQLSSLDARRDHEEFGRLMGFPKSAIEGFISKNTAPKETVPDDPSIVTRFRLSRDHWQEEQELQRRWSRAIQHYAPEVYQALRGRES